MTPNRSILFLLLFIGFSGGAFAQFVTVDDAYTAQQLVQNVLVNSPCANVSDIRVTGDTFSAGEQSYGYFNSGGGAFPFADGVILSTARAKRAEGPNNSLIDEGNTSWTGDSELEQALQINNTVNATSLEFDFTPLTSQISFDYIFASEEYHDNAQCQYSDGFAFLLKELNQPGPYQNLAVIPNTNTPVLVTNVHPAVPGGCPAANETYFGSYNDSTSPINFNGQTAVLTAQATVIPGRTYHIKLVIADQGNYRYDSAIFLGGGSFKVGTDLGADQLIATNNPVCEGKTYVLDATETGTNTYKWYKDNVIIAGATNPTYTVTTAGVYKAEINLGATACVATGEVTIEYTPKPVLSNTTIVQCDQDDNGIATFNLDKVETIVKNGDNTLGPLTYYTSLSAAQSQDATQMISNTSAYVSTPRTVYASASNSYGCTSIAAIDLQITYHSLVAFKDVETCDLDGTIDGFYTFHLSDIDPVVLNGLPSGLVVEYYPTFNDATLQTNSLSGDYTNVIQYQEYIFARIVNGPDCYGLIPVHLFVNSHTPPNFQDETVTLCEGGTKTLQVAQNFFSYDWSNGGSTYSTEVTQPGEYTVTVSDLNTCLATKKFIVVLSYKPNITSVDIDNFNEDGNSVQINYSGSGEFEFSLDGINFQDSPYFANVIPGTYTAYARDKNGCGFDTQIIEVLNYPKFFTPNGDGFNDVWTIKNLTLSNASKISIFDRMGKLIYQLNSRHPNWDGKYNARDLPASDYWFVLQMDNGKTVRGHFALKR